MSISPAMQVNFHQANRTNLQPQNKSAVGFKGEQEQQEEYKTPFNKTMEMYSGAVFPSLFSAGVGVAAWLGAKTEFIKKNISALNNSRPGVTGLVAGLATAALTLVPALYHRHVSSTYKGKELDVATREYSAKTNLSGEIAENSKDPEKLDKNLNDFLKYSMAKRSTGVGVFNAGM